MASDIKGVLTLPMLYTELKCSKVERILSDVRGITERICNMVGDSISQNEAVNLVMGYIFSSRKVQVEAIATKALHPRTREDFPMEKWAYHFVAFKNRQKVLAEQEHRHNPDLDCDGAWYKAQQRLAEEILLGNYEKTEELSNGL